ncbi:MAG: carboxypeptidase-like regulatory domain-containing protein, partial [Prevotella sp.]|nr:carboxypeptidase-like regulatory domain-containing protein [Prevotella sp.]
VFVDVVKNLEYIFEEAEMEHYDYRMESPTAIDDRQQVVISMRPRHILPYPLYFGRIYIDQATLAFTRVELELDMTDREKATRTMLVSKPMGVRFRPRELTIMIDYVLDDSISRIHYVRSTSRFNCDWKRKLFSSSYRVSAEMVVTDRYPEACRINGRSSFDAHSSLYDKVELFEDPGFWGKDNIIEPTESLESAIEKLRKKIARDQ